MLANIIAVVIWAGISAYAVFGGADFGGGVWDLVAGNASKGREPRALIERSIGPVWEANHVWLIFVLVYLWTAFPEPFISIATTMWIPLSLAAFGIIFRGAGFAFRKWADTVEQQRLYGSWFAGASALTPFFLGTVAGGVASGRVPLGNAEGDPIGSWLNPTSLLGGALAVVVCAFLAAVLLTRDASLDGEDREAEYFRARAVWSGLLAGAVAVGGIAILRVDAPSLFDGLTSWRGSMLVAVSAIGGIGALFMVARRRYVAARPLAALAVVSVLWGWGASQYPWVLEDVVTIEDSAASSPVLWALIIAFSAAAVLAVPSLLWLYRLTETRSLSDRSTRPDSTTALLRQQRSVYDDKR